MIIDSDPKSDRADKAIVPKEGPAISQLGDLWALGEHRILCADARLEKSYEVLLEDKKAAMVISDPPYNVPIKGHVGGKGKIQHREFAMASGEMSAPGVRRGKAALSSGCESHPANRSSRKQPEQLWRKRNG